MSGPILQALAKQREQHKLMRRSKRTATADEEYIARVPLHERPFDPSLAPQQLAHAKQRIRDLEQSCSALAGEMAMLKNSMIAKDDILRYVRESVLHDCLLWSASGSSGDAAPSDVVARRAEYQKTLKSMLDVELLHSMSFEADKVLILDQLAQLEEKVRLMTAKDVARVKAIRERDMRVEELELANEELRGVVSSLKTSLSNSELALAQASDEIAGMREQRRVQTQMNKSLEEDMRRQAAELQRREASIREISERLKATQEQLDSMTSASAQNGEQQLSLSAVTQGKQAALEAARSAEQLVKSDSMEATGRTVQAVQEAGDRLRTVAAEAGIQVVGDLMKHASRCIQLLTQNMKMALKREEDMAAAAASRVSIIAEQVGALERPLGAVVAGAATAAGLDKNQRVPSTAAAVKQVAQLLDGVGSSRDECLNMLAEEALQRFAMAEQSMFKGLSAALGAIASQIDAEAQNAAARGFKSSDGSPAKLPGTYSAAAAEGIKKCVTDLTDLYGKSAAQLFPSSLDAKMQLRREAAASLSAGDDFSDSVKATFAEYQLGQFDSMVTVDVVNSLLQVVDRDHAAMNAARKDISNLHTVMQQLQQKLADMQAQQKAADELSRKNSSLQHSERSAIESQEALIEQLCKDVALVVTAQQDALSCSSADSSPAATVSNGDAMTPDGYLCARGIVQDLVEKLSAHVKQLSEQQLLGDVGLSRGLAKAAELLFNVFALEQKESSVLWQCFAQFAPSDMLGMLNSPVPVAVLAGEKKGKAALAAYRSHLISCRLNAIDSVREQKQLTPLAQVLKPPAAPPAQAAPAPAPVAKAPKTRAPKSEDKSSDDAKAPQVASESKSVQTEGSFISEEAAKKATMAAVNAAVQQIKPQMSAKRKPPTVEEAEEILKAAGKWVSRRESSVFPPKDDHPPRRPNWTQTEEEKKPKSEDKEVATDGELLDSFLGLSPTAGGCDAPRPRKRSVSYVQVFGETGVLERIASGVELERGGALSAQFKKISSPSIPDLRRGSVPLVPTVTGFSATPQRATSKYSIASLLSKKESMAGGGSPEKQLDDADKALMLLDVGQEAQSEEGSEGEGAAVAEPLELDPAADEAAFRSVGSGQRSRRPSTAPDQRRSSSSSAASIALAAKKSLPMHTSKPTLPISMSSTRAAPGGPADFYTLLLHNGSSSNGKKDSGGGMARPSSAASCRPGGSPHSDIDSPSSLHDPSKKNLRQRAAEVEKLHNFIHDKVDPNFGVPKNPVEMRIARIQSVIAAGTGGRPPTPGENRAPARRQSVRQLIQQACGSSSALRSSIAAVCPDNVTRDKTQHQISAWDAGVESSKHDDMPTAEKPQEAPPGEQY